MSVRPVVAAAISVACSLALTTAMAQSSQPSAKSVAGASAAAPGFAPADKEFVESAALGGMTEVKLGQLAHTNAVASGVKEFAAHMVEDHSKANDELASIAKSKGVLPPASLDSTHKAVVERVSAAKGKAFDKAFMSQMVTDHKKTIGLFEKASKGASDPDIKAFAAKTLPTLKDHLKMAQDTSSRLKE